MFKLPADLLRDRFLIDRDLSSPFSQRVTFFEDLVIRCVKYAFATLPASIGRIFFSKGVSYPFYRWRLFRSGHLGFPCHIQEIHQAIHHSNSDGHLLIMTIQTTKLNVELNGVLMVLNNKQKPDVVIYYCHGW